jgi:catechol 2,3-dioxygenase-like lactoylglutathione lyase family enzyme
VNLNQVTVPCLDLEESVEFYRRLGLELIVYDAPKYARFECPDGHATFSVHLAGHAETRSAPVVYFEVEDLDERVRQLEAAGLVFESAPVTQEWLWREAYVRDPAGNRICVYYAGSNRLNPPWRLRD